MKQTQESQSSWCVYVSSATRSLQFHMNPLLARSHRTSWMPKLGQKTESLDTEQSQSLLPQFMKTSQPKPGDYILPVSFSPRFKINLTFELSLSLSLSSGCLPTLSTCVWTVRLFFGQSIPANCLFLVAGQNAYTNHITRVAACSLADWPMCYKCQHSALEDVLSFADVFGNFFCDRFFHRLASCKSP